MTNLDRITQQPGMMGGKPCIRGMRVTVAMIVGQTGAGRTIDELLADYPISNARTSCKRSDTRHGWLKIDFAAQQVVVSAGDQVIVAMPIGDSMRQRTLLR